MARKVKLNLGPVNLEWEPNDKEQSAAWDAYVELTTRVSGHPAEHPGLPRETLQSLYSLFQELRAILRKHGQQVAMQPASIGAIVIGLMNGYLRPFLSEWHPRLLEWDETRAASVGSVAHSRAWQHNEAFNTAVFDLYSNVETYRDILAQIAGISID